MKNVTKGECQIIEHNWSDTSIVVGDKTILTISIYDEATEDNQEELEQEANANANLIADAFNTYNSCSLSPSELKQQRDELLEALREIKNAEHGTYKGTSTYLKKVASDAIDKALKLSNNDTDK